MIENVWKIASPAPSKKHKNWLLEVLAKNRGLVTPHKLQEFLNPKFGQILNINIGPQTQKAVEKVASAIKNRQKIIVYSDYDADGICATAIAWETLYDLGADVLPYVPHRIKEGYGLSIEAIRELAKKGANLIITVDHGVTATRQIEEANKLGIDVIVTDHHVLPKNLPKPYAMVHTTDLCGAGVAWRFCWEIVKKIRPSYQDLLIAKLELAAIATIADLVPLLGANRAIVKIGLENLSKTKRPGIKSLLRASGITGEVGTYEIGHVLAPRINAMGRIEHGIDSLRLLCAKSQKNADSLAALLSKTNTKRQDLTVKAVDVAHQIIDHEQLVGVVTNESWHEGVIGLVASRLVETYHRPMVAIAKGEIYSKGSARSIVGFNIVEAIRASSEYLVDAGGHPMAAGFTIETKHLEIFTQRINQYAENYLTDEILTPVINIECPLDRADINRQTLETIGKFEPFGMGNREPIFLTKNMLLEDIRRVGVDNRHLKLQLDGLGAIGFNLGQRASDLRPGYQIDLVYTLAEDNYNGNGQLQLKIKDLAISNS